MKNEGNKIMKEWKINIKKKKPKSWGKNLHGNTHWEWKWLKRHNNKERVENEEI
jgi:hypothetical protein